MRFMEFGRDSDTGLNAKEISKKYCVDLSYVYAELKKYREWKEKEKDWCDILLLCLMNKNTKETVARKIVRFAKRNNCKCFNDLRDIYMSLQVSGDNHKKITSNKRRVNTSDFGFTQYRALQKVMEEP